MLRYFQSDGIVKLSPGKDYSAEPRTAGGTCFFLIAISLDASRFRPILHVTDPFSLLYCFSLPLSVTTVTKCSRFICSAAIMKIRTSLELKKEPLRSFNSPGSSFIYYQVCVSSLL